MGIVKDYLPLAKYIAKKTRKLIPRSANRWAKQRDKWNTLGKLESREVAGSYWEKKKARWYLSMQIAAKRSGSSANKFRKLVDGLNKDLSYKLVSEEQLLDNKFFNELKKMGWNPKEIQNWLKAQGNVKRCKRYHKSTGDPVTELQRRENSAKNAVRYRIGNCGECSDMAFMMFMEYDGKSWSDFKVTAKLEEWEPARPWVEKVYLDNDKNPKNPSEDGDHAFILLHRDNNLDVNNDIQWVDRSDIIICDPWAFHLGDSYPADQLDRSTTEGSLLATTIHAGRHLAVSKLRLKLGSGHSIRFQNQEKYKNLNYLKGEIKETYGILKLSK